MSFYTMIVKLLCTPNSKARRLAWTNSDVFIYATSISGIKKSDGAGVSEYDINATDWIIEVQCD